jgi:7,8-dihydropterin-6-yl-methyl-4-(beta-D-ribofuranosyl)aminobenzene 5'-phosphate synthase
LVVAKDDEIEKIVTGLRDTYKVAYIAPGHCTGEPTFTALKKAFGDRYLYAGLGTTFSLDNTPRPIEGAADNGAIAMDEEDLASYRMLLISSDDYEHSVLAQHAH